MALGPGSGLEGPGIRPGPFYLVALEHGTGGPGNRGGVTNKMETQSTKVAQSLRSFYNDKRNRTPQSCSQLRRLKMTAGED
jgi:hypothetical protein